jgi:hypothetical protein
MKAGDIISEEHGQQYELKSLLGQGLWAKTFIAKNREGVDWVLKIPLSAADFPSGQEHQAEICRKITKNYGEMLTKIKTQDLLCPQKIFTSTTDIPILVFKYTRNNLEQRLRQKVSFQELLGLCIRVVDALDALPLPLRAHGNIHPRNIFIMERDRIVLSDPVTPLIKEHYAELNAFRRQYDPCFPPEIHKKTTTAPAETIIDTYCVAAILFRGLTKGLRLPLEEGITKEVRVPLHDSIMTLLHNEPSNKLFHNRLCTQLIQFLNRSLSVHTSPSPPYRFASLSTFQTRLVHIYDLIEPSVTYVGQIMLERSPGDISFLTSDPVRFSCTIECTPNLDDIEEIDCGVRLTDQTRKERIKGYELGYNIHTHPSGRLRFDFSLGTLDAAQYTVKIAFKIKGSSSEVRTMEKDFEVEPEAGWVPQQKESRVPPIILTPDPSQLQVLIEPEGDDESSDITEEFSDSVVDAPPLSLVSNSDPESFFPSDERIDHDSWRPQPDAPLVHIAPPTTQPPLITPKNRKKEPKLIIRPVSPKAEPSSYEEASYTFSVHNIQDIEVKSPPTGEEERSGHEEESSVANPFGTTWETSHARVSEDLPASLLESSESEEEGDVIDQLKTSLLNIRKEPYHFFVAVSICIIILLILITINI